MPFDEKQIYRISGLLLRLSEGQTDDAEMQEIRDFALTGKDAVEYCAELLMNNSYLMQGGQTGFGHDIQVEPSLIPDNPSPEQLDGFLADLAEYEKTAPETIIPKVEPPRELIQKVVYPKTPPRQVNKFSLYTLILSAAAMLLFALWLQLVPVPSPTVATITDSIDAQWAQSKNPLENGSELRPGALSLKKGFAKIKFDKGTEVLIEGPADFELVTDEQMMLYDGKISARVPERAIGFIVQTPTASIIDYGTEFGVEVDEAANVTQTHVFAGLVELRDNSDPARFNTSKQLKAGMAASVRNGRISKVIKSAPEQFIKKLPSEYEMAVRRTNPKSYWRFAESLTNIIGDETLTGLVEGEIGSADIMTNSGQKLKVLSIDPHKSDGCMNYGDILDPGRDSFTVSLWIKPLSLEGKRRQFIATKSAVNGMGWRILTIGNDIMFRTGTRAGETVWIGNKNGLATDWHHVVMVIDRQSNTLKGYLDGSEEGWSIQRNISRDSYSPGTSINTNSPLLIGRGLATLPTDVLTNGVTTSSFHGLIYDVTVWKRALSKSEVRELHKKCPLSGGR